MWLDQAPDLLPTMSLRKRRLPILHRCVRICVAAIIVVDTAILIFGSKAFAQNNAGTRRYPSDEYFVSLNLLREGRPGEAQHGWELALEKARRDGNVNGIDAVPSIIRIGESLILQGSLEAGLNQIEEGLLNARRSRRWIEYVGVNPMPLHGLPKDSRSMLWHESSRSTQLSDFPDFWPTALSLKAPLTENFESNKTPAHADPIRLDALSIYLAMARGLWLRSQWLGEVAVDMPVSLSILEAFPPTPADLPEVLQQAHQVCRALAMMSLERFDEAEAVLRRNLEIAGQWEHPLTGVALMALSDLAYRKDDMKSAYLRVADASLLFARLNHFEWLADALVRMASMDSLSGQRKSLKSLDEMTSWLRTRNVPAYHICQSQRAMVHIDFGNDVEAEEAAAAALHPIKKPIEPSANARATALYVLARLQIKQGKLDEGLSALDTCLALLQGNDEFGPGTKHLLQLHWVLASMQSRKLSYENAMKHLDRLLEGPSPAAWRFDPLDCLASTASSWDRFADAWLEGLERRNDPTVVVAGFDRIQMLRQRYRLPIAARDLDLRLLFHGDPRWRESMSSDELGRWRKLHPAIDQAADEIEMLIRTARTTGKIDPKHWTLEQRRTWEKLYQQCDKQESRIVDASLQRFVIPRVFPGPSISSLIESQPDTLGFFQTSKQLHGYLIIDGRVEKRWVVDRIEPAKNRRIELMNELAVDAGPAQRAAAITSNDWKVPARALRSYLIPDEAWKLIQRSKKLVVIPDDWLWYVPFELLPEQDAAESPVIKSTPIHYAIGLKHPVRPVASVETVAETRAGEERSLVLVEPNFFVDERELQTSLLSDLSQETDEVAVIDGKTKFQPSLWSRLQYDCIIVGAKSSLEFGGTYTPLAYDTSSDMSLQQWTRLPIRAPSSMLLLGNRLASAHDSSGHGSEVSQLVFTLSAGGNHRLLLSRWPMRGESAELLAKSFIDTPSKMSVGEAWRRAVLNLWETPLTESNEPSISAPRNDREIHFEELTGVPPIFWSGMMPIESPY
jgi:tetratricopeptide (TPR) repeat protein